ncbi:hypothetical protein ACLOJK_022434 [Asimina triloba]
MDLLLPPVTVSPLAFCCSLFFVFASPLMQAMHPAFPIVAAAAVHLSNETDRLALLRFKGEIIADPFGYLSSWNDTRHFCEWQGITCGGRRHPQRVTALNVFSYNLVARSISPHISNLTFLRLIDLSNNTIHGVIPAEMGRLFRLRSFYVEDSTSSGEIPVNLTRCSELMILDLYGNKLSGNIPPELGSLSKLSVLALGLNNLTGRIPPSLGNLSSLTGSIPAKLSQLTGLSKLDVFDNQLSGIVPSSIYNLSALQQIDLGLNRLQGDLPPHLFLTLPNLAWFSVGNNRFTGSIPVSLPNATSLQFVLFYTNYFKGSIPVNLGRLQELTVLGFAGNKLGGGGAHNLNFLDSLTNCSKLKIFDINSNGLSAALPDSVANLSTQLEEELGMASNMIFGSLPSGIGNLVNLTLLDLEQNMLTGAIPLNIGKLRKMVELYMFDNKLSGEIPNSFCNMTKLNVLYLSENNLEGNIPQCLENCRQLQDMRLDSNNLKGTLPKQLFTFPSLYQILIGNNSLSGNLQMEVGRLKSLQTLDASDNNFSGEIPSSLGDCPSLEVLKLGGNRFQGLLPSTLNSLRGLRHLDLSRNHLSGKIPDAISVIGNSKLCGGIEELHLPPCIQERSKKTSHVTKAKVIVTVIVLGSIVLSCLLASFVYIWLRKSRKKPSSNPPSSLEDPFMDVSYSELLKATDGFSSSNLIGMGSYGSVFKGTLHQKNIGDTIVAVKVLNLLQEGALKSFMAECEALRNIRHRNLIKTLTCCSSIDFQGNDFKALVFEYMPNGSLQNWLSKDDEGNMISGRNLKFIERLNIAIDVASALDYLHYHCQAPIVHRDLKPSNVLLDADMVAHVGDFGLARFASAIAQSSTVGMKGSIGYIAPEYGMGGKASITGDVYSYGILALEMLTGKGPTDGMFENNLTLRHHVRLALLADQVAEIVDPYLLSEEPDQALRLCDDFKQKMRECLGSIARIGVACSAETPGERMQMNEVVAQMHAIRDLYLGVRGQGRRITTEILGEGSSYLSNY